MYALPLRRWISLILVKLGPAHSTRRSSVSRDALQVGNSCVWQHAHAGCRWCERLARCAVWRGPIGGPRRYPEDTGGGEGGPRDATSTRRGALVALPRPVLVSLYTILHCQYCMVYGIRKGGSSGVVYCAIEVQ